MTARLDQRFEVGQIWRSEWDVEWRILRVAPTFVVAKRIGGRSEVHFTGRDVEFWENVTDEVPA